MDDTHLERFLVKLETREPGECWNWKAATNGAGYGYFAINGKPKTTHRLAFEHWVGVIPEGKILLHLCSNRRCCNPDHLKIGTHSENHLQAYREGREPSGAYRRTPEATRQAILEATGTATAVAARFGVSKSHVSRLRSSS